MTVVIGSSVLTAAYLACCRESNQYRPEDLTEFQYSGDVLLDVCSAEHPPQLMLARQNSTNSLPVGDLVIRAIITHAQIYDCL